MARRDNNAGKPPPKGKAVVLSPKTAAKVQTMLDQPPLEPDPRHFRMTARAGNVVFSLLDDGSLNDPRRGGGGRFLPSIGGDGRNKLFVSLGTVTYVPIAQEDRDDVDQQPQPRQVEPIFPKIDGTALNDTARPSFDVSAKSSAAVWLCTQRLQCGSTLPTESEDPERLVLVDRGEKPEEVDGEIHRLLFECDLADAGGGAKAIKNLDQRIASDVDVCFLCEESEVSVEDTSPITSADLHSSELDDVSDPFPSDSTSDPDCPWHVEAQWVDRHSCYPKDPKGGSVTLYVEVAIDLGPMFKQCRNWYAFITASPGSPKSSPPEPGQLIVGEAFKVALTKRKTTRIYTRFYFIPTPCKAPQSVTIRLESEQKEGVEEEDEQPCCGSAAGSKTVIIGNWPAWCGYGGACASTTVLPP